jgi:Flp pilus assembly pilin Flp
MSDITTTLQDSYRELCIQAYGRASGFVAQARKNLAEERGQTAAEYMGILLIVAVIIGALFASGIGKQISDAAKTMVTHISAGDQKGGN